MFVFKIKRERSEPEKKISVGRIKNHRSAVVSGGAFEPLVTPLVRVIKTFYLY